MKDKIFWENKKEKLHDFYSPSAPINSENLFSGRSDQLKNIHGAVSEKGLHIVLYGERGVGKTSLANIVEQRYKKAITVKITCNSASSIAGLWKNVFNKIPIDYKYKKTIGFSTGEKSKPCIDEITKIADLIDPNAVIKIDEITGYLEYLKGISTNFLIIFDEFDQITTSSIIHGFSNIMKYLSDNIINVTVMIVGIGNVITDLIGEHESIERCITQIPLGRMSDEELGEIVVNATKELDMEIETNVLKKIVAYSSGFPHYTHLLGKYSTRVCLDSRKLYIKSIHFKNAMIEAIENVNESIRITFQKAILSAKSDTLFEKVLYACALVETDEYGTFRATDLEAVLENEFQESRKIQAFQYHLGKFCTNERGKVLERITLGKAKTRYRIKNPLVKAFILLRYHNMKESALTHTRPRQIKGRMSP